MSSSGKRLDLQISEATFRRVKSDYDDGSIDLRTAAKRLGCNYDTAWRRLKRDAEKKP